MRPGASRSPSRKEPWTSAVLRSRGRAPWGEVSLPWEPFCQRSHSVSEAVGTCVCQALAGTQTCSSLPLRPSLGLSFSFPKTGTAAVPAAYGPAREA